MDIEFDEIEDDNEGLFIVVAMSADGELLPAPSPRVFTSFRQARFVAYTLAEKAASMKFIVFRAEGAAAREPVTYFAAL